MLKSTGKSAESTGPADPEGPTGEQIRAALAEIFHGEGQPGGDPDARCFLQDMARPNERLFGIHRGNDLHLFFVRPDQSQKQIGDRHYTWDTATLLTTFVRERADQSFGFRHVVFPELGEFPDPWIRACDFKAAHAQDVFDQSRKHETARRERNEARLPQVVPTVSENRDLSSPKETINGHKR